VLYKASRSFIRQQTQAIPAITPQPQSINSHWLVNNKGNAEEFIDFY